MRFGQAQPEGFPAGVDFSRRQITHSAGGQESQKDFAEESGIFPIGLGCKTGVGGDQRHQRDGRDGIGGNLHVKIDNAMEHCPDQTDGGADEKRGPVTSSGAEIGGRACGRHRRS